MIKVIQTPSDIRILTLHVIISCGGGVTMLVTQLLSLTHDSCLCLRLESLLSLNLIKFTAAPPPKYSDRAPCSESRVYVASLLIPPPGSVMALVSLSPVQQLQAGRAGAVSSLTPGQGRFEALGQHSGSSLALCSTLTRTVTSSGTDQK